MDLVRELLETRNYWAAENLLQCSVRRLAAENVFEVSTFRRIWSNALGRDLLSHIPEAGEVNLLAKLDLLQIFFEAISINGL